MPRKQADVEKSLLNATPYAVDGGLDFGFHAADEFAVGVDQGLLGFDLGDDGALGGEVGERDLHIANQLGIQVALVPAPRFADGSQLVVLASQRPIQKVALRLNESLPHLARTSCVTLFEPFVTALPTHSFSPRFSCAVYLTSHLVLESKVIPLSVMRPVIGSFRIVHAGLVVHQVSTAVKVVSVAS